MLFTLTAVTDIDPLTYMGVTVVLILTTLGSVLVPALRASRVDPVEALNTE